MSWDLRPFISTINPIPQFSCSNWGSYKPCFLGMVILFTIYKRLGISKRNEYSAPCRYTVKAEGHYTQDFCKLRVRSKKYVCRSKDIENHFLNVKVHRSAKKNLKNKRGEPPILAFERFFQIIQITDCSLWHLGKFCCN